MNLINLDAPYGAEESDRVWHRVHGSTCPWCGLTLEERRHFDCQDNDCPFQDEKKE